jgi:hypothetical protein
MAEGGAAAAGATDGAAQLDAASLAKLPDAVREAYQYAVAGGTHTVFLVAAAISVLGFVAAWFIKEVPLKGAAAKPADADADAGADTGAEGQGPRQEPLSVGRASIDT